MGAPVRPAIVCYHCGDTCGPRPVLADGKSFCCDGCKTVYELLAEHNLCTYYHVDGDAPGIAVKTPDYQGRFAYLDDPQVADKLLTYQDQTAAHTTLSLPQMHCSSCVWLLEHLYRLDPGVTASRTDFLRKEIRLEFRKDQTSLRKVVELLTSLGYEPRLHLDALHAPKRTHPQRQRIYRIAVAGFCFSNIMLLSFPEYFHLGSSPDATMSRLFNYLNLALALPVFAYSGGEFFASAWKGLKARFLNIDIPLALSILITFGRSLYEILTGTGAGYLDSMAGIIFFMLIGRYFQDKTHLHIHFDRNYRSYFPIAVTVRRGLREESIPLSSLRVGDRIIIRSGELIPADSRLISGYARVDYSFVTGESEPVRVETGQPVYAGGRQTGAAIELEVMKAVEQSYLTSLWNKEAFQSQKHSEEQTFVHRLARNFSIFLIALSAGAFLFWLPVDPARGINALTTVLIVACPCALLLSATFTHGSVLRILSRHGLYLKNERVIEALSRLRHIVFDKTGTITESDRSHIRFEGGAPDEALFVLVRSVTSQSNHPRSRAITRELAFADACPVDEFREYPGKGIEASVNGHQVRIGSSAFVRGRRDHPSEESQVHVSIDDQVMGYFTFSHLYREELPALLAALSSRHHISLISGDHDTDRAHLEPLFGSGAIQFDQSPEDKLHYITRLSKSDYPVAMIGDGLNDAGALRAADVGIAVSDQVNNFSPACDAVLEGSSLGKLDQFLSFARKSKQIIYASFVISLLYNIAGISFAVQGNLQPVVAAILMPLSSLTIILFTTGASQIAARQVGLR